MWFILGVAIVIAFVIYAIAFGLQIKESQSLGTPNLYGDEFRKAVQALTQYIRKENPDYIVGVNPTGRLLSAYLASAIGIKPDHCKTIFTTIGLETKINGEDISDVEGKVIVIDDVSRTGRTLEDAKKYIQELSPVNRDNRMKRTVRRDIKCVALVEVMKEEKAQLCSIVDWSYYVTQNSNLKTPWTVLGAQIRVATEKEKLHTGKLSIEEQRLLKLGSRLLTDTTYAVERSKEALQKIGIDPEEIQIDLLEPMSQGSKTEAIRTG